MRVCMICRSDLHGGAATVTYRLMRALRQVGCDVRLLVADRRSTDLGVLPVGSALSRRAAFLSDTAANFLATGLRRDTLFKIDTARFGLSIASHPDVRSADVIVLSWVNQGMLSLSEIRALGRLGKPIVWAMHDMWCLTGMCHHAGECTGYRGQCGCCPMVHPALQRRGDASHTTLRRKLRLYDAVQPTFVAVSHWLAERARESTLLGSQRVDVIPNAFPGQEFSLTPELSRTQLGLPEDTHIIIMVAARLDDTIKRLPLAVEALNEVHRRGAKAHAVLVGEIRCPEILASLKMPHTCTGPMHDARRLASLYAHSAAVLSTSACETLPGTLIEGQACGAYPVATHCGGQADIIADRSEGWLTAAGPNDEHLVADLADGLQYALEGGADREALRRTALARFDASAVARQYVQLFDELVSAPPHSPVKSEKT